MVADYSYDVKNIDIWVPAFFKHNNSFIATVFTRIHTTVEIIYQDLCTQAEKLGTSWIVSYYKLYSTYAVEGLFPRYMNPSM